MDLVSFPGHLTPALHLGLASGQRKFHSKRRWQFCILALDCHPVFAQVRSHGSHQDRPVLEAKFDQDLDWDPRVAAPLSLHQSTDGAEAGLSPLQRDRLEKDEVGP